jgi:hypothetical protein
MLYDETTGEFKPRFGYQRIDNGVQDLPIVEVKEGQDPYADPWNEDRKSKKARVEKNKKNQGKNLKNLEKTLKKGSKQFGEHLAVGTWKYFYPWFYRSCCDTWYSS